MPYFVYAIHTDHTHNRMMQSFSEHEPAAKFERDMQAGTIAGDNYFVWMLLAADEKEAEAKANALRPHPKKS